MADNVSIARGIYEAFGRGDIATVLTLDAQAEWNEAEHFTYVVWHHLSVRERRNQEDP